METISKKPSEGVAMSARAKRVYCTQNEHVTYEKKCVICGKTFTAKSDKARVCSTKCGYQVKKAQKKVKAVGSTAFATLTPEQKRAIQEAGGVAKIAQMPIGELTSGQKALGWLSLGLLAWMVYDETKRREREYKRKYGRKAYA